MRIISVIFFLVLTNFTFCQNLKEDFIKMNDALLLKSKWTIQAVNYLVLDEIKNKPVESTTVNVSYNNSNLKVSDGKSLMIVNEKNIVAVSHIEKSIVITPKIGNFDKINSSNVHGLINNNFDSIVKLYRSYQLKSLNNDLSVYNFTFSNPLIEKAEIVFHKKSYLIYEINMWLKEPIEIKGQKGKHKVIVCRKYLNYNFNPKFDKTEFSESNYISANTNGKFSPTKKYSGYKLYNLNENRYEN